MEIAASGVFSMWQALSLVGILGWVMVSPFLGLTQILRSSLQPWVARRVLADTPMILSVQSFQHQFLDVFFSVLSFCVSVPFYTGFLPLFFWSGHGKLARQVTLLIAFCDYVGNFIKDLISAPRPKFSSIRILAATDDEKEHAMEFGLPSSHALNTLCLAGYLLHYYFLEGGSRRNFEDDRWAFFVGFFVVSLLVILVAVARVYLGMHSIVDVMAGIVIGIALLAFWIAVDKQIDDFIISDLNGTKHQHICHLIDSLFILIVFFVTVTSFSAALSLLLCFAYPTPEHPTPSFEFHVAFTGVAFGIVSGVQQTFHQFHHDEVARVFSPQLTFPMFIGRVFVGIPVILGVKFCSKTLSKLVLPVICSTLGVPIRSSCYIPALKAHHGDRSSQSRPSKGYLQKLLLLAIQDSYDVDTGIRFLQYAGLAWSVVDLVPSIFCILRL